MHAAIEGSSNKDKIVFATASLVNILSAQNGHVLISFVQLPAEQVTFWRINI